MKLFWWLNRVTDPHIERDIDEARRAKKVEHQAAEVSHHRWDEVRRIVAQSHTIRQVNHIAEDLRTIFRG